ncbi:MAG: hypothetical protein GEV06_20765 [Luteitalea sp.]|nr:hypothetical protein [Luteitalea sp.]
MTLTTTTATTTTSAAATPRPLSLFEFEDLEALPCGCVSASYRARPWDITLVSLEAKGEHCLLPGHAIGAVLQLGEPVEEDAEQEDEE